RPIQRLDPRVLGEGRSRPDEPDALTLARHRATLRRHATAQSYPADLPLSPGPADRQPPPHVGGYRPDCRGYRGHVGPAVSTPMDCVARAGRAVMSSRSVRL